MITRPAVSLDVAALFVATIERRRLPLAALFTATGASLLGRQIATIAIPWAIYAATGSLAQSGLAATCLIFPWLLTDPTGNAFVDRLGHKSASIAAGIAGSTIVATIPLLGLAARLPVTTMLVVAVLFAVITALGSASRHALMPEAAELAGRSAERAGGAFQAGARAAIVIGTLLAGLGITQLEQDATLGIAAALIAIAAAADVLLVPPVSPLPSPGRSLCSLQTAPSSHRPAGTLERS